jgi:hypothetical protein
VLDFYKVPILLPNFTYSIRLRASSSTMDVGANLVIDLYSPAQDRVFGSFATALSDMTAKIQEFDGTLLTTAFATSVQSDLILRVYVTNLPDNGQCAVDRMEIYPTTEPVLGTELQGSYVNNLEAFDGLTGPLGVGAQNNQRALGAFSNYDKLYILKTNSMLSTRDSPGDEPSAWDIREVSNKVGVCGINAYDYGEEWAVFAHRSGVYAFGGSEPVKISQEIQPTWDAINWTYQHTICVRNDTVNRKIFVMAPMVTPNQWLPNAEPNSNPTIPNVILMLNYRDLTTVGELASRGPLHVSAFGGKLISWDMCRKWSIWQIGSPYADFIQRQDGSAPLFFASGSGNSEIYRQIPGLATDDGAAINWIYDTYGFVKAEQEGQWGPLLGDQRKLAKYLSLNLQGDGNAAIRVLPNTLSTTSPYTVPGGATMSDPAQFNTERPLNVEGQRLYLEFSSGGTGARFQLSEAKLTLIKAPFAPIRGV